MTIPQSISLSQSEVERIIFSAERFKWTVSYLEQKHQLVLEKGQDWMAKLYLPWSRKWDSQKGILPLEDAHYALTLIRAGQAAVGYFHQGKLLDHKVFRAYMVRQKQGKSQIKHLKTKGKSRAGSRIRLAETERFFEEINERLQNYSRQFPIGFWGISCGKTLWPYLFSSEVTPPFSSKDSNLIELPFHISQASFEELEKAGELLGNFHLILSEKGKECIKLNPEKEEEIDSENW
ncbi:hypothetical protein [Algoriphagus sp. AK58]|uniref:hypothetical protein n=1 Tax=Algoriphagus sp. AK58 TaxID=1406877 RepID=UPI00164F6C99|nr:hypothetical protein [Algoriphagus sp. AK58]